MKMNSTISRLLPPILFRILIGLVFISAISVDGVDDGAKRVAIVGDEFLAGLAIAELSSHEGFVLVERDEISRVLAEQKIRDMEFDGRQAIRLGKLLSADIFAVVENEHNTKNPISVVVYAADSGIRLRDTPMTDSPPFVQAKTIVRAVTEAVDKHNRCRDGKIRYLSMAAVRNAGLPRTKDPLCRAVALLLIRMLAESRDIAVLERTHLNYLIKERQIHGNKNLESIVAATDLIELELQPGDSGQSIQATVFMNGIPAGSVVSPEGQPEVIAAALAKEFIKSKGLESAKFADVGFNRAREARHLLSEYEFLKSRNLKIEAHEKIMAYHALSPENPNKEIILSCFDVTYAAYSVNNPSLHDASQALDIIELAIELVSQWYSPREPYAYELDAVMLFSICSQAEKNDGLASVRDRSRELLLRLNELRREQLSDGIKINLRQKQNSYDYLEKYLEFARNYLININIEATPDWFNEQIVIPVLNDLLNLGILIAQHRFPEHAPLLPENFYSVLKRNSVESINPKNIDYLCSSRKETYRELFDKLKNSAIPTLAVLGYGAEKRMQGLEKRFTDKDWDEATSSLVEFTKEQIVKLGDKPRYNLERGLCYSIASEIINPNWIKDPQLKNYGEKFFDFMIARNELALPIVYESNYISPFLISKYDAANIRLIASRNRQILKMIGGQETKFIGVAAGDDPEALIKGIIAGSNSLIKEKYPELLPENNGMGMSIVNKFPVSRQKPVMVDDRIFFLHRNGNTIEIRQVILPSGKPHKVFEFKRPSDFGEIRVSKMHGTRFFISTASGGLAIVPISEPDNITILNLESGLASNYIQAFDIIGDKLFLATGETDTSQPEEFNLYEYDISTRELTRLASSGAKSGNTPFDNLNVPPEVIAIFPDPQREKIIMIVGGFRTSKNLNGIWSYSIIDKFWEKIAAPDDILRHADIKESKILIGGNDSCYLFDIETESFSLVYRWHKKDQQSFKVLFPALNGHKERICGIMILTQKFLWSFSNNPGESVRINLHNGNQQLVPIPAQIWYADISLDEKYLLLGQKCRNLFVLQIDH